MYVLEDYEEHLEQQPLCKHKTMRLSKGHHNTLLENILGYVDNGLEDSRYDWGYKKDMNTFL